MTKQVRADLMLVVVTMFWGISYILTDFCLDFVDPLTINAYRFLIAFFTAAAVSFPKLKNVSRATLKYSVFLGLALTGVYITYTFGLKYTTISNAGFLCGLSVVFTPILGFIFKGQRPCKKFFWVIIMCIVGIGLLTLNSDFKPAFGDVLCILCAVFYASDLLIAESAVRHEGVEAFQVGVFQLGFTGLFMALLAVFIEKPVLITDGKFWASLLVLAIFSTGLSFIMQVLAQQHTTAAHAGVIFTLEPVFAGIAAFAFAGEVLSLRAYLGAAILISSLFVMEVDFKKNIGIKHGLK